jgi:uncharacterized protein
LLTTPFSQHTLVRDLEWVIANPPIIQGLLHNLDWTDTGDWNQAYKDFNLQLNELNQNPIELIKLLEDQHDYRLGHRFETLLTYWFKHNGRHEVLAQNLQVQDNNRTIGEFDFIVKDHLSHKTQHWEVACKFYIGLGDTSQAQHWVGPMLKDRLDIKYHAMRSRQSKLSAHPAAKTQLKQLGISIDEHICLMKGRLFYPIHSPTEARPNFVSSSHQHGQWARTDQFLEYFQSTNIQWQPLNKNQWMASQVYLPHHSYYTASSIVQYFLDRPQQLPLCVAGFLPEKSTKQEISRVFLVAKDWAKNIDFTDNTATT